ncbi:MAG: hypothetical protein QOJ35_2915 [Solirubrobacteraceae bacterium]|nr:hypothetical protein [Solirubrobacteraceae bacterium]
MRWSWSVVGLILAVVALVASQSLTATALGTDKPSSAACSHDSPFMGTTRDGPHAHQCSGRRATPGAPFGGAGALGRSDEGLLSSIAPSSGPAQSYSYDGAQRLASGAYQYDAADNFTQTSIAAGPAITQTYDVANQLQSIAQGATQTAAYTYDQHGQRTKQTPTTGALSTYTYDQAGQLTAYSGPDRHSTLPVTANVAFGYDASGLRQSKTVNGLLATHVWNLADGIPQMIEDGANAYISGPDGLPIEQISQTGIATYYTHDQLGSTTALTTTTGQSVATYAYDPYGNPTTNTATTTTTPFRYAGEYTDGETGLQYLQARYYDPATGQFLTRDPLISTTRQAYAYAANTPTNATDPTGQTSRIVSASALGNTAANIAGGISGNISTSILSAVGIHINDCATFYKGAHATGSALALLGLGEVRTAAKGVPDAWVVVRGGTKELAPAGEVFSGAAGHTLEDAASGVPHGTIRHTTAGEIRAGGGTVEHAPELTRGGNLNDKHVNVCLGPGSCPFSPPQPNPVPPGGRIR